MNTIGHTLTLTLFGASHERRIGCVLDGIPPGYAINEETIAADLLLRKPTGDIGTPRVEADIPEIFGIVNGKTTGAPVVITFSNNNTRSTDYEQLRRIPRPGHADYPAICKYGPAHDIRGGGMFSGRMTTPLVAAGSLLREMIADLGISVGSYVTRIGNISDTNEYDPKDVMTISRKNLLRAMSPHIEAKMRNEILSAKSEGDSVGGIVRCIATGLPVGLGEPFFDSLDGEIAKAVFGIPGVKAIGFGEGFGAAGLRGSENNDPYRFVENSVITTTNHAGGVLGGMANGAVFDFSVAFKPTSSIAKEQMSVDLLTRKDADLTVSGRHDPCIAHRGAIVVEAMTVFTFADLALRGGYLE